MTHVATADPGRTWPFWAPSREESVVDALELAGVGPGVHVVDLGCGDGQVLLVAAHLGATVGGIEADPELAEEARDHLRRAGIDAEIVVGDLLDPTLPLRADVFFTYLAPATLQRLLPRLEASGASNLVAVDFDVPGVFATDTAGDARHYRLPARRRRPRRTGWTDAGTLIAAPPDCQSLQALEVVHPAGPTGVSLSPSLRDGVGVFAGADHLAMASTLAIDLRVEEAPRGTSWMGSIRTAGCDDHALVVVVTEEDDGMWDLRDDAVDRLAAAFAAHRPTTLADALAVADG